MSSGESKGEGESMCHELYHNKEGDLMICTLETGHKGDHFEDPGWSRAGGIGGVETPCHEVYRLEDGIGHLCTLESGHKGEHYSNYLDNTARHTPTVVRMAPFPRPAEEMCRELYSDPDEQTTMICTLPVGHDGEHFDECAQEVIPPSISPSETSRQLERQGFLQHERTVNKLALFFRKHYQREMREGRHSGMTMDQCVIHYLQRERAVPGWIKEWCLRLRGDK